MVLPLTLYFSKLCITLQAEFECPHSDTHSIALDLNPYQIIWLYVLGLIFIACAFKFMLFIK